MKMRKFTIFLTVVLTITSLIPACISSKLNPLIGKWRLERCVDQFSATMTPFIASDNEQFILHFHDTGFFSFTTDCNTVSGDFEVKNNELHFINPSATELACEHEIAERCIKSTLPIVDAYDMPDDSTLRLLGSQGNTLIVFHKKRT